MDQKIIHEITGRAIADPEFREGLRKDPEGTLRAAGYTITPELVNAIKAANKDDLDEVATQFEKRFPGGLPGAGAGKPGGGKPPGSGGPGGGAGPMG
jgi:hypothetical protein